MTTYKTEQEKFWAGDFGNKYIERNNDSKILVGNISLFSKILERTIDVKSIIEFGVRFGLNLNAIQTLLPKCELSAIEINVNAAKILSEHIERVYVQSIFDFKVDYKRDFVFTKGVLIHINPDELNEVYEKLYASTNKYICIVEYYNPTPVTVNYRGEQDKLFKRDFAGEMMDKYNDLELVDYGFKYRRDNNFQQDDLNWFLLKK